MVYNYLFPEGSAIVDEFAYLTICTEGNHIFSCLDGYVNRIGSGIKDDMGCYFARELDPRDSDRKGDTILVYREDAAGVHKVHISEPHFYQVLVKAFDETAFLFNEEQWHLIQVKLDTLKTVLCPH